MNEQEWFGLQRSRITNPSLRVDAIARTVVLGFDAHKRRAAIDVDAQHASTGELSAVWLGVLRGELVIADAFYTPERWYAALAPCRAARPVEPSYRRLLMHLLLGESQKQTAVSYGISDATVSSARV